MIRNHRISLVAPKVMDYEPSELFGIDFKSIIPI